MKNGFWKFFGMIGLMVTGFFLVGVFLAWKGMGGFYGSDEAIVKKPAILVLDLRGVIMDGRHFLKDLRRYREKENIKGIVVRIDSPGGVVGPSQEIYAELKRTREEFKKPVIASVSGLAASGAYYSAVAADQIITNPGAIIGSIGVIMELANLEDLYSWAKIKRYSLKTGKFKDTGADYRKMSDDERQYLQGTLDEVLAQFVKAVAEGRKLTEDRVRQIADGRIVVGETALKLGLVDKLGTFSTATEIIGEMTGLGKNPELLVPPRNRPNPFEILSSLEEDDEEATSKIEKVFDSLTRRQLLGKPLFLMPGTEI